MGIFDSVFGGNNKTTTSTQTSNSTIPEWQQQAGQQNYAALKRTVNKPYQAYTGERVAGANPLEQQAWGAAGNMLNAPTYYDEAANYIRQSAGAPAGQISMPKSLSSEYAARENPYEKDYMNPYVQAMLDPAIRSIRESGDINRNNLAAEATSSGAFGDYRHGIEESMMNRDETQNIADVTGQAYGTAYGQAQAARSAAIAQLLGLQGQDVSNQMGVEGSNAALMEQMFGRQAAGGGALSGLQGAQTANELDRINAAAGAGQSQRGIQQAINDFAYQQYAEGRDWDQESINALMSALSGTPTSRQTIQTTQAPDTSMQQLLGSVLGAVVS
jgi:hypothetical protein